MRMIILTILILYPLFTKAEINLDLTDMTLPEALTAIGESVSEDSPLYQFEFKLPRAYKNKGEKLNLKIESFDEKSVPLLFRTLAELHGLIRNFQKNDDGVIRFMHPYGNEQISLLEAIGASERYLKGDDIVIPIKEYQLLEAAIKYEKSETYSGYWWHLKYSRTEDPGGVIHIFVYSNSFVEHVMDSQGIIPAMENTENTIIKVSKARSAYH